MPEAQWQQYEDIVRFEVRRSGAIYGLDRADVAQEMRVVVINCVPRIKGNTGRTYVRSAIRNALANLKRTADTQLPKNPRGRAYLPSLLDHWIDLSGTETTRALPAPCSTPEQLAETKELMNALRDLSASDKALLYSAFVDGVVGRSQTKVEQARKRAEGILTRLTDAVKATKGEKTMTTKRSDVPFCHTHGTEPVGYETELAEAQQCQDCADKFSCLPEGIKTGLLQGVDLSIDSEVKAGFRGLIPLVELRKRLEQRSKLRDAKKEIPADLTFDNIPSVQAKLDTLSNEVVLLHDPSKGKDKMSKSAKVEEETIEEPEVSREIERPRFTEIEEDEDEDTAEPEESDEADESEPEEEEPVKAPKAKKAAKPTSVAPPAKAVKASKPVKAVKAAVAAKPAPKAPAKAVKAAKPAKVAKTKTAPEAPAKAGRGRPKKGTVAAASVKLPKVPKVAAAKATKRKKSEAPRVVAPDGKVGFKNRLGEKGFFRHAGKPKDNSDGSISLPNGRKVPAPRAITPERMTVILERLNGQLGLDFDLAVGMTLVQERRNGDPIEIKLKKDGFYWNDTAYSSLSTAVMAALRRVVAGTDMFNFSKRNNIVVKGKAVPGGSFRRAAGASAEVEDEAAE